MRALLGLLGILLLMAIVACPVDEELCFADSECPSPQVCRPNSSGRNECVDLIGDAGTNLDGGGTDAGASDAGMADAGPRDAGRDASVPDAGDDCPPRPREIFGAVLDDGQSDFGDRMLFHLDEATSPFVDTAGLNLLATCQGAACPIAERCGVYGGALAFDGVDDGLTVEMPIPEFDISGQFYGFETWFRAEPTNTSTQCLFEYTGMMGEPIRVTLQPDGTIGLNGGISTSARAIRDGAWWHLGLTRGFDGTMYVTLNREDVLSGVMDMSFVDRAEQIQIGRCSDGRHFEGLLDEVRMARNLLHPESDFSVSRPEVRVAWESGADIHVGNERLTQTRMFAAGAMFPAFSADGSTVAYLKCGAIGDTCDLYRQDFVSGQETRLTNSGDLGRARVSWLNDRRIYYARGAACNRTVYHYDLITTTHTPVVGPGVYGSISIGRVLELDSDTALFIVREVCGSGSGGLTRIDDPLLLSGPPTEVDIYTLSSTVGEILDVRALPQFNPFVSGLLYLDVADAGGGIRNEESFWNGPLFNTFELHGTNGGRDLVAGHFVPYFFYAAAFGPPWDHEDEASLEIYLMTYESGDVQRLTNDTVRSRRPTVWYSYPPR